MKFLALASLALVFTTAIIVTINAQEMVSFQSNVLSQYRNTLDCYQKTIDAMQALQPNRRLNELKYSERRLSLDRRYLEYSAEVTEQDYKNLLVDLKEHEALLRRYYRSYQFNCFFRFVQASIQGRPNPCLLQCPGIKLE